MAIDFRCNRCGRLVSVEADESTVTCPGCWVSLRLPTEVAALPLPPLPPGSTAGRNLTGAAAAEGHHNRDGAADVLPAIRRAFEVLSRAPGTQKPEVIYLLPAGEFADNNRVVETIRKIDGRGTVRSHTILHHCRKPAARQVLKQIADDNHGEFRCVKSGS